MAKHGYVLMQGGWFSDRSVCYLASGRPVLLQDTGLDRWLPTGEGIVTFRSVREALDGIDRITRIMKGTWSLRQSIGGALFRDGARVATTTRRGNELIIEIVKIYVRGRRSKTTIRLFFDRGGRLDRR